MTHLKNESTRLEQFNVRLVKCTEPILIKDLSSNVKDDKNMVREFNRFGNVIEFLRQPLPLPTLYTYETFEHTVNNGGVSSFFFLRENAISYD